MKKLDKIRKEKLLDAICISANKVFKEFEKEEKKKKVKK